MLLSFRITLAAGRPRFVSLSESSCVRGVFPVCESRIDVVLLAVGSHDSVVAVLIDEALLAFLEPFVGSAKEGWNTISVGEREERGRGRLTWSTSR